MFAPPAWCAEKGIEYALRPLDFGAASHRELHSFLKMPAMRHGDLSLFETAAIATYVDGLGQSPALQPETIARRALMWQWVSCAIDHLYDPLVRSALSDDGETDHRRAARREALDALEARAPGSPYLAGDALSLADLFVAPMIAFAAARQTGGGDAIFAARPRLAAWYEILAARDSFKRTAE